jgi:Protein of unknown function (DUF3592)
MTTFFTITIGIALLLLAPTVLLRIWKQFWIEGEGVITGVRLGRTKRPDEKVVRTFHIQYQYVAANHRFTGTDNMQIDVPYYEERDAVAKLTTDFKPGDAIAVYYAESAPALSALRRSVRFGPLLYAIGFLVLITMAYGFWFGLLYTDMKETSERAAQSMAPPTTAPAGQDARQP